MNRSLDILISSGPYYIGQNLIANAVLTPPQSGLMYVWIDQDGIVIDKGIDLSSTPISITDGPFNRSIIVSVLENEIAINASVSYTCQYQMVAVPPSSVNKVARKKSNMELHRWLSYMPKWSFANKSHLSSYAKLSNYSYSLITDVASKPIIMSASNMTNATESVDYNKNVYKLPVHKNTKLVVSDLGICENIGPDEYTSFDQYPVSNCYIQEGNIYIHEYEFNTDTSFTRFNFPIGLFLYLTSYDNTEDEVKIVGLDQNGKLVSDTFKLHPRISHRTINKYKAVIGVYSKTSFNISTTTKSDSYISGYINTKRIVDIDGNYFEPFFKVDDIDPTILNITKDNGIDVYKFRLNKVIDKFVVTENLDIFFLSESTLYSAKMYLDVGLNIGITSTYNNNDICEVIYENVIDGDKIEVDINILNISKLGKNFTIQLKNSNNIKWFDQYGNEVNERLIINTKVCPEKITINKQKLNNLPYIFSVEIEGIKEVFQAGVIDNNIDTYKICEDVYDINMFNGHIYISSIKNASQKATENNLYPYHSKLVDENLNIITSTTSSKNTFKLIPVRCCYSVTNGSIVFPQKIKIEEVLYEWFTRSKNLRERQ